MSELIEELKGLINDTIDLQSIIRVGKITNVNRKKMTVDVKLIPMGERIENVPCSGLSVSENKGVVVAPKKDEYVLLVNYFGRWFVVAYLYDVFSGKGYELDLTEGEVQLKNKTGNKLRMYENGDIELISKANNRIVIRDNGRIEILNKNNYGIVIEEDGHMYLYYSEFDMYSHSA